MNLTSTCMESSVLSNLSALVELMFSDGIGVATGRGDCPAPGIGVAVGLGLLPNREGVEVTSPALPNEPAEARGGVSFTVSSTCDNSN